MQLVILAAGHGRRFGGLKQLAPIGPNGEALMDYTASTAESCGFDEVVLVVREAIHDEIERHVAKYWSKSLGVTLVDQGPVPGTAQAVLSAKSALSGPFGVVNADDLYEREPLGTIARYFDGVESNSSHLLVAYQLSQTVLSPEVVTRGLCEVDADRHLVRITENTVRRHVDGRFSATPFSAKDSAGNDHPVDPATPTSMNLWGFHLRILDHLDQAVADFNPASAPRPELLLPEVVGRLVDSGEDRVAVIETDARCVGITHRQDADLMRSELERLEH